MTLRRAMAIVLLIAVTRLVSAEQAMPGEPQPTFRASVTLATVDVSVIDDDWRPVAGLTAADFQVDVGGVRREVRAVDFQGGSGTPTSGPGAAPAVPTSSPEPRTFVLLADDLSYEVGQGRALLAAAERFVTGLPSGDFAAVVTSSGRVGVEPTSDRPRVTNALRRIVGLSDVRQMVGGRAVVYGIQVGLAEAIRISNRDAQTLDMVWRRECIPLDDDCLKDIIDLASSLTGAMASASSRQARAWTDLARTLGRLQHRRIVLVILSRGVVTERDASVLSSFERGVREAGIRVHILSEWNEHGDVSSTLPPSIAREDAMLVKAGLDEAAGRVGGTFQRVTGMADRQFARILSASSGWYRLGVEIPPDTPAGKALPLRVRLARRGLTVHVAREAIAPGPVAALSSDDQVQAALGQGRAFSGIPVTVGTSVRKDPAGNALQLFIVGSVPSSVEGPVAIKFALVSSTNQLMQSGESRLDAAADGTPYVFDAAVAVPPGSYRVRVAVTDGRGAVGSIEHPLQARLGRLGPHLASDFHAAWIDEDARRRPLAADSLPETAVAIHASMELYPERPGPAPAAAVTRAQLTEASGKLLWSEVRNVDFDRDVVAIDVQFPIERLEPGAYALTIALLEQDVEVGTRAVSFRKRSPSIVRAPSADLVRQVIRQDAAQPPAAFTAGSVLTRAMIDRHLQEIAKAASERVDLPAVASDEEHSALLQRLSESGPSATRQVALGLLRLRSGDNRSALAALEAAIEVVPDSPEALLLLGVAHAAAGRDPDAAGAWQIALNYPSAGVEWHLAHADALARIGDLEAAAETLAGAQSRWPDDSAVIRRLGELLFARGRFDEGRAMLERALLAAPRDDRVLFLLTADQFARALASDLAADREAFAEVVRRYLSLPGKMSDTVREWQSALASRKQQR